MISFPCVECGLWGRIRGTTFRVVCSRVCLRARRTKQQRRCKMRRAQSFTEFTIILLAIAALAFGSYLVMGRDIGSVANVVASSVGSV